MSGLAVFTGNSLQLLYNLAAAILNRYGHEGRELIRETVYKFGYSQGKQIRRKVEALGLDVNLENFLCYNGIYDQSAIFIDHDGDADRVSYELRHWIPEDQALDDAGKLELGQLFCELDRALLQGYNRLFGIEHSSCLKLGSHSCHFVSRVNVIKFPNSLSARH